MSVGRAFVEHLDGVFLHEALAYEGEGEGEEEAEEDYGLHFCWYVYHYQNKPAFIFNGLIQPRQESIFF